jgi:hypothetical protein
MCHHRGPHGVEFDIAQTQQEIGLGFDYTGSVAALPQGAGALIRGVDIGHIAPPNGLHPFGNAIGPRGRYEQMDMIGHQDIGMDGAAITFGSVVNGGEVQAIVLVSEENRLAIIAPLDDVVGDIKEGVGDAGT